MRRIEALSTEAAGMSGADLIPAALRRAAQVIAALPLKRQEVSDRADMLRVLRGEPTGRDGYVTAKALAYAIGDGHAESEAMRAFLLERCPVVLAVLAAESVLFHTGAAPDLGREVNEAVARLAEAKRRMRYS